MRCRCLFAGGALLFSGCGIAYSTPNASQLAAHEQERQHWYAKHAADREVTDSVWNIDCTDDLHGTAERRCSAKNGKGFGVSFVDGRGPYIEAGPHWHVDRPSVVRVDKAAVHITGKGKQLMPADAVVSELLKGETVYATCYKWPYDTPHHTVNSLKGFKEAYAELLKVKTNGRSRRESSPLTGQSDSGAGAGNERKEFH